MSIKSLFEDIADAIREKSGSSDTYTPAEMPSAIRSIPSGSSTASGVSYDNTSSGLTASNVQDAIDELSGDVSTINSDLSELRVVDSYEHSTSYGTIYFSKLSNGVKHFRFDSSSLGSSSIQLTNNIPTKWRPTLDVQNVATGEGNAVRGCQLYTDGSFWVFAGVVGAYIKFDYS